MKVKVEMEMSPKEAHELMYHAAHDPQTHFDTMMKYWKFWDDFAKGKLNVDFSDSKEED